MRRHGVPGGEQRALDTRLYLQRRGERHEYLSFERAAGEASRRSGRHVGAQCFMVDRHHPQYAGRVPLEMQAWLVRRSAGKSGANIDYVVNTMLHLRELGVHDAELERLMSSSATVSRKRGA